MLYPPWQVLFVQLDNVCLTYRQATSGRDGDPRASHTQQKNKTGEGHRDHSKCGQKKSGLNVI